MHHVSILYLERYYTLIACKQAVGCCCLSRIQKSQHEAFITHHRLITNHDQSTNDGNIQTQSLQSMKHAVTIIDDMQSAPRKQTIDHLLESNIISAMITCRRCIIDQKHVTMFDQRNFPQICVIQSTSYSSIDYKARIIGQHRVEP